jgi:hypothetical protein
MKYSKFLLVIIGFVLIELPATIASDDLTNKISIIKESNGLYIGEIKDNEKNGWGIYLYKNHNIYIGQWSKNKRNGIGRFDEQDIDNGLKGYKISRGIWENDEYLKNSTIISKNKSVIGYYYINECDMFGQFSNNELNGMGITLSVVMNYDLYIGNFEKGRLNGEGVYLNIFEKKIIYGKWETKKINDDPILINKIKEIPYPEFMK